MLGEIAKALFVPHTYSDKSREKSRRYRKVNIWLQTKGIRIQCNDTQNEGISLVIQISQDSEAHQQKQKKEQNSMFCQFVFPKVVVQRSAEMSRIGSPDLPVQSSFRSHRNDRREMFFHCKGICKGWFFKILLWFVPSWKHGPLLDKQGSLAETDYLHIKLSFYPNYLPL